MGDSQGVYAAPSRLQVNDAGSSALNVNVAASPDGYSADRLVCGGVLSPSGVGDALLAPASDGLVEGVAASVLGDPLAWASCERRVGL